MPLSFMHVGQECRQNLGQNDQSSGLGFTEVTPKKAEPKGNLAGNKQESKANTSRKKKANACKGKKADNGKKSKKNRGELFDCYDV